MKASAYYIILTMLKILFDLHLLFWPNTICNRNHLFYRQLAFITVDETYLI